MPASVRSTEFRPRVSMIVRAAGARSTRLTPVPDGMGGRSRIQDLRLRFAAALREPSRVASAGCVPHGLRPRNRLLCAARQVRNIDRRHNHSRLVHCKCARAGRPLSPHHH